MTPRKLLEMRRCPWSRPWRKSKKTDHDVYGVDPTPCAKRVATPTPRGLCTGARGEARVAHNPRPAGRLALTGRAGWRIRVGDYRVIYEIDDAQHTVTILHVGHRR